MLCGISVDGLLESDLGFTNQENIIEKNYYAFMTYNYMVSSFVDLKPSILYKEAESGL